MTLRDKIETFLVLSSIFVILWTARLAFIYLVSDHWFGTLGLTSLILGTITYLSWKDRLGRYGAVYKKSLNHKLMKKFTILRLGSGIFFILVFSAFSAGMHAAKDTYQAETAQVIQKVEEQQGSDFFTTDSVMKRSQEQFSQNPTYYVIGFLSLFVMIPYMVIFHFPLWAMAMGAVNHVVGGQFVHVIDIILIEQVEILGLMIFVRHVQKRSSVNQTIK